ncbi:MAG TPA: DUF1565 domain-containing protein [Planctomycetes bacterium]|nr:DUF1565 domain-containing protein [Planctomycetota bacterium]
MLRSACRFLIVLVSAVLVSTHLLAQTTWYVAPSGNDANTGTLTSPFKTLTHAHAVAADGDTIELAGGLYTESLSVARNDLTIRSAPGQTATIQSPALSGPSAVFRYYSATSGGRLERLEIVGGYFYGVHFSSNWSSVPDPEHNVAASRGCTIIECNIHDTGRDAIKMSAGCDDILIKRCEIHHTGVRDPSNADGVDIVNSDRVKVQECHIHDIATNGAYAKGGARDVVFENNYIHDTGGCGLIAGFYADEELFDASNPQFYESIDLIMRNNVIERANGAAGILSLSSLGLRVYGNTVVDTLQGNPVQLGKTWNFSTAPAPGGTNLHFENNIFYQSTGLDWTMFDILVGALGTNIQFDHNLFFHESHIARFRDRNTGITWPFDDFAAWQARGHEANGIANVDPLLDANLHLSASSPALGQGADLSAFVSIDYDGDPRGVPFDMGADQYQPGTALPIPPGAGTLGTGLVLPIPTPPSFTPLGTLMVPAGATVQIPVVALPGQGGALTLAALTLPAFATFTDNGQGQGVLTLSPTSAGPLTDHGTILASEAGGTTATLSFSVVVTGVFDDLVGTTASMSDTGTDPTFTLDRDYGTRWSGFGTAWIQYEFDGVKEFSSLSIAFYHGDQRIATFDVEVSYDGVNWTQVASGVQSSGQSLALETFMLPPGALGRFLRIVGHGNTLNGWNSYTEVDFGRQPYQPISLATPPVLGTTLTLDVAAPFAAGAVYATLFSLGTSPGVTLPDGRIIPLAPDFVLTASLAQTAPYFTNTTGMLDAAGSALPHPMVLILSDPALAGTTIYAGLVTADPADPSGIGFIGPALPITLLAQAP